MLHLSCHRNGQLKNVCRALHRRRIMGEIKPSFGEIPPLGMSKPQFAVVRQSSQDVVCGNEQL